jgi:hypothetical protein
MPIFFNLSELGVFPGFALWASHFSLCAQRKVTKRNAPRLLGFAAQNFPRSEAILGVAFTGHPWPDQAQLGIPPN